MTYKNFKKINNNNKILINNNRINNTWIGFHFDIQKQIKILKKNFYPGPFIERIIDRYL